MRSVFSRIARTDDCPTGGAAGTTGGASRVPGTQAAVF
eukprot:COSAG02_NODE_61998_length_267_cov_0.613095_1_plen_37_part_01